MSLEDAELSRQLAALTARVERIEAELARARRGTAQQASRSPSRTGEVEPQAEAPPSIQGVARLSAAHTRAQPSLEARIGSQLFNRVGIIALLVGAAWFLKFAIDRHWIGPLARVLIGAASGALIISGSEWFRSRGYRAFSYSLKALGTGILYLSLWAAYSLFALIPASAALIAMILVTASNAWLSWRQNSEVLAFYAAIGGLLTPLLLWSSESRELTLFSYLLLLDLAVLAQVALRPWSRLLLAAFAGTAIYAVGWYVEHYTPNQLGLTAFFVVVFFLLFSAAPQLLRNLRLATAGAVPTMEDGLSLFLLPLLNGLLAFAELYALLSAPVDINLRAWVAIAFGAFYLGMLRLAMSPRLAGTPARLADTYLTLSVLAFTGAVPLAFSGRLIAISWAAESAGLLALARRFGLDPLRVLGGSVWALAFAATIALSSAGQADAVIWNARFATYMATAAAGVFASWVAGKAQPEVAVAEQGRRVVGILIAVGTTVLLMLGVCLEINSYWSSRPQLTRADRLLDEQFSYSAWTMLFGAGLLAAGFCRKQAGLRWLGLSLLALSIGKVFFVDLRELSQGYRILSFLGLGALLLAVSFVYQRDLLGLRKPTE
jgi:uncharacterized membrane protein